MDPFTLILLAAGAFAVVAASNKPSGPSSLTKTTTAPRPLAISAANAPKLYGVRLGGGTGISSAGAQLPGGAAPKPIDYGKTIGAMGGAAAAQAGCSALGPAGAAAAPLCGMAGAAIGAKAGDKIEAWAGSAADKISSWF